MDGWMDWCASLPPSSHPSHAQKNRMGKLCGSGHHPQKHQNNPPLNVLTWVVALRAELVCQSTQVPGLKPLNNHWVNWLFSCMDSNSWWEGWYFLVLSEMSWQQLVHIYVSVCPIHFYFLANSCFSTLLTSKLVIFYNSIDLIMNTKCMYLLLFFQLNIPFIHLIVKPNNWR